jgi:hypothetical protein
MPTFLVSRNPAAVQYVIAKSEQGEYGVDSPYVDGTFSDDVTGTGVPLHPPPPTMSLGDDVPSFAPIHCPLCVALCAVSRHPRGARPRPGQHGNVGS